MTIKQEGNNIKNVPNLRFPGFEGEWETKKLGEITSWSSGGTPSKDNPLFWNGDIPWISASSMRGLVYSDSDTKITKEGLKKGSKLASKGSLLILVRGSMLFNKIPVGIASKDVAFNQDVKSIVINDYSTPEYVLNWFLASEAKLLNMVTGTGIGAGKLDLQDLKELGIKIPSLPEQRKIASFLSLINSRIETQNKIIEQLETLIRDFQNQLFKQKIRLKDELGNEFAEWDKCKLGDISKRIVLKNPENNQNVLTISAQFGLISQLDFFNKSVSAKNVLGYYLLKQNDFAYNKSYSNGYPMGAIKRLKRYEKGIVSTLYICFRFNEAVSTDFMEQYFESGIQNSEIEKIAQEGARNHGLLNVGVTDFFDIEINLPTINEQKRIAAFLSKIDQKIQTEKTILEQLEKQKKYLLQQMFI